MRHPATGGEKWSSGETAVGRRHVGGKELCVDGNAIVVRGQHVTKRRQAKKRKTESEKGQAGRLIRARSAKVLKRGSGIDLQGRSAGLGFRGPDEVSKDNPGSEEKDHEGKRKKNSRVDGGPCPGAIREGASNGTPPGSKKHRLGCTPPRSTPRRKIKGDKDQKEEKGSMCKEERSKKERKSPR